MPKKKTSSSPKKKSPLKGKKKKYKISYLQKQRKKACLEGDIDFYVTEELEKLDAEVNEKEAEVEEARKKKVESPQKEAPASSDVKSGEPEQSALSEALKRAKRK